MSSAHNIDILLRAKDQASKAIRNVNKELGKTGKAGSGAGKALRIASLGIAAGAGAAAGILTLAVKTGLDDLATLETAVTSVDGAIKTVGLTGQVTGAQIAGWANQIESDIGAAFDDKDITAATATLLRFGHVTQANIKPAMVVMTDLAAKTGSVASASSLLSKALADPTKAAGKLARQGIILTKAEQKQIAALMKAGKVGEAQAVILDKIAKSTKGAAAASQGPYQRALSTLADVSEDARKALAIGFMPVLEKLAGKLSKALADPAVVQNIENFGKGLAGGLDDLIAFGEKVPWGTIATGLQTAATWTGKLFDAFRSIPPEAQATIVALAGLNKLSGGAISGIVGQLGQGLVKGVLGMTAGVVNINAGAVNGGGAGIPGGAAGAAGGGVSGLLGAAGAAALGVGVGAAMKEGFKQVSETLFPPFASTAQEVLRIVNPFVGVATTLENLPSDISKALNPTHSDNGSGGSLTGHGGPGRGNAATGSLTGHGGPGRGTKPVEDKITSLEKGAVGAIGDSKTATVEKLGSIDRTALTAGQTAANAATGGASRVSTQSIGNTSQIVGAIGRIPAPYTKVIVNVSGSTVTSSQTTQQRTGASGGSRTDDSYGYAGHGKG